MGVGHYVISRSPYFTDAKKAASAKTVSGKANPKAYAGASLGTRMTFTITSDNSFLGELWKEYALSDSRYMTSDPSVLLIEAITVFYGDVLYYTTTLVEGAPHCSPHPFYFYAYFVFANMFWIVIPSIIMFDSGSVIIEALKSSGGTSAATETRKNQNRLQLKDIRGRHSQAEHQPSPKSNSTTNNGGDRAFKQTIKDARIQGNHSPLTPTPSSIYTIQYWQYIDDFIYFSHERFSIPPVVWTTAAHRNGVSVYATFITEGEDGTGETMKLIYGPEYSPLRKETHRLFSTFYADKMVDLAVYFGFDGWFINIESPLPGNSHSLQMSHFIAYLTRTMHNRIKGGNVMFYDSLTKKGKINWQDRLSSKNKIFFESCDSLFTNYTWKKGYPAKSASLARKSGSDCSRVYTGIDTWGRNTFGGGGYNVHKALRAMKPHGTSCALFAPGWTFESQNHTEFAIAERRFWCDVDIVVECEATSGDKDDKDTPSTAIDPKDIGCVADYIYPRPAAFKNIQSGMVSYFMSEYPANTSNKKSWYPVNVSGSVLSTSTDISAAKHTITNSVDAMVLDSDFKSKWGSDPENTAKHCPPGISFELFDLEMEVRLSDVVRIRYSWGDFDATNDIHTVNMTSDISNSATMAKSNTKAYTIALSIKNEGGKTVLVNSHPLPSNNSSGDEFSGVRKEDTPARLLIGEFSVIPSEILANDDGHRQIEYERRSVCFQVDDDSHSGSDDTTVWMTVSWEYDLDGAEKSKGAVHGLATPMRVSQMGRCEVFVDGIYRGCAFIGMFRFATSIPMLPTGSQTHHSTIVEIIGIDACGEKRYVATGSYEYIG
ncbi:hypothetical protein BSLG_004583 [Batrachochytrium salamandrivorans]|nr:hypothetical protein BSLG_004583 [Batrachochytrium salamandrivorans]